LEKRFLIHLSCFSLALAVILGGSTVYYAHHQALYQTYTQTQQNSSFSQLLNHLNQLETSLEKASYVPAGALRQTLAADIWMESQLAASALSSLPLGDRRLDAVETYLSQAGDYAYYLLRSSVYDRANNEEWATLCALASQAETMLARVDQMKEQLDSGSLAFSPVTADAQGSAVSSSLLAINDEFPAYASLIYDGPYSDHISQQTAKALEGQVHLSTEEAAEKAAQLLGATASELTLDYESQGQIPTYGFSYDTKTVALSQQGGLVLSLTDGRGLGNAALRPEEAIEKAASYLRDLGFPTMKHSYYTTYETIMTINFHCYENGVIVYPDLIKVSVALDDGSIVRLDTSGFAMNHQERQIVEPVISQAEARQRIPENLIIEGENLAYIPTTGKHEVLCWEFVCKTENSGHVLLYINCENGQAENILMLIESANGTLTR